MTIQYLKGMATPLGEAPLSNNVFASFASRFYLLTKGFFFLEVKFISRRPHFLKGPDVPRNKQGVAKVVSPFKLLGYFPCVSTPLYKELSIVKLF